MGNYWIEEISPTGFGIDAFQHGSKAITLRRAKQIAREFPLGWQVWVWDESIRFPIAGFPSPSLQHQQTIIPIAIKTT